MYIFIAALSIGGVGWLTWAKNINYVRAAVHADQAAEQFRNGKLQAVESTLERAIDLASDVSSYYNRQASMQHSALRDSEAVQEGACGAGTGTTSSQVCLAEQARAANIRWLEERPLKFRSRLALADSLLDLGVLTADENMVREATVLYREAAEMVPNSWRLWRLLAEVYIQVGQPEAALPPLQRWRSITGETGNSVTAIQLESEAYRQLGRHQDAIAVLSEGLNSYPDNATLILDRAVTYTDLTQHSDALDDLNHAIDIDPLYPQSYLMRGSVFFDLSRFETAIEDFDHAVQLNPEFTSDYNFRGLAYAKLGQRSRAIEDFELVIWLAPENAPGYNNRGFVYRDLGQLDQAIQDLDRAIELDPDLTLAYFNR
ncbi:tetratricopeptide repeat protein, partial [Dehalococcoidia bacterium]|nr:tetratricopeptide repeat protein [Dehalococcoidia bacterium]